MSGRKDFLNQVAPDNYVAGLGRGATGFTTRSDLGPAREGPSEDQIKEALAKRAQQLGAAPPTAYGAPEKKEEDDDEDRFQDPENETGLFASGNFDREDDEADRIYQDVEEKMEKRRKSRREAREAQERADYEANNPKIQQQFADLKRSLASISEEDWANLPEPGDLTRKNKRAKTNAHNRHYAVPDSVIAGARDSMQMDTSVVDDGMATNGEGPENADGTMTNFADIGAARDKVLQVRLDQAAQTSTETSGTATNIDPKGYLTSLSKSEVKAGEVQVGDIKRVRVLLDSVIKTNISHAPGWIALARLEEVAGKIVAARNVVNKGCEHCQSSPDIWQEAIRLHQAGSGDLNNAKIIAAKALKALPLSSSLWIAAMELETEVGAKKRVIRKAIDHIPKSVPLWREAVNLEEEPSQAALLLSRGTEEIPLSVELWLTFARLSNSQDAQKILNKARQNCPTSFEIWVAASKLQEQLGHLSKINVMKRAVQSLAQHSAMLTREEWITQAEKCETEGFPLTATAIIRETLAFGLDEDDSQKATFIEDAQGSLSRGKVECARAIYAYALRLYPTSETLWKESSELEKNHGTKETLTQVLEKACEACPSSVPLWLEFAKTKWSIGDIDEARKVLGRAFNQLQSNENIYLAAVDLEANNGEISHARDLLQKARQEAGTDRVWYKSVAFERQNPDTVKPNIALDLCVEGLNLYPKCWKLHAQKGQIYASQGKIPQAREAYNVGTRACPLAVPLYLLLSRLEESPHGMGVVRARSVLERGLIATKSPLISLEQVRVERRAGHINQAKVLMAKALQAHPNSGILWSESIWHLEPRTQRKPRSLEAIKKVENNPVLFATVARIFWGERRLEKSGTWFEKAILSDKDLGDSWAWYWKFLMQHGTEEKKREVLERFKLSEPKHGEVWQSVSKEPGNSGLGIEEVLNNVVALLE